MEDGDEVEFHPIDFGEERCMFCGNTESCRDCVDARMSDMDDKELCKYCGDTFVNEYGGYNAPNICFVNNNRECSQTCGCEPFELCTTCDGGMCTFHTHQCYKCGEQWCNCCFASHWALEIGRHDAWLAHQMDIGLQCIWSTHPEIPKDVRLLLRHFVFRAVEMDKNEFQQDLGGDD